LEEEKDIKKALANKKYFDFPESIINHLAKLPQFSSQYAAYSTKALNNLLPLMRVGKYWNKAKLEPLPKEKKGKGFNDFPSVDLRERIETLPTWVEESNIQKMHELN
jgi:CRISPR-associated endonuclease Csn1